MYTLTSRVPPRIEHSLRIAERMRTALLAWTDGHPLVSGKDIQGSPLQGHHHARFLPLDEDQDGHIDHIVVSFGVDPDRDLVRALPGPPRGARLWGEGHHDLELGLIHVLSEDQVRSMPQEQLPSCLQASTRWQSCTPFLLSRHPKQRSTGQPRPDAPGLWKDGPEAQVRKDLEQLGVPDPVQVTWSLGAPSRARTVPWHRFDRERKQGGGSRGSSTGFGFVLEFDAPVRGPLSIGYGSHMGLGQFRPLPRD